MLIFICDDLFTDTTDSLPTVVLQDLEFGDLFNRGIFLSSSTGSLQVCATILPAEEEVLTYQATFFGPIVGKLWVRCEVFLLAFQIC